MRSRRGMTLVELMIAMAIFSVLAFAIADFIISSQKVNGVVESETEISVLGQSALDDLRGELAQSRRILDVDSGFLDRIDLTAPGIPPAAGEVRLPRVVPNGSLTPKAGFKDLPFDATAVGNAILFVKALPPWKDKASGRLIDEYCFVLYYVAKGEHDGSLGHMPYYLQIERWQSQPYADFQQVDSLGSGPQAADLIRGLTTSGVHWAWDAGAPPVGAFSRLENDQLEQPPDPHAKIAMDKVAAAIDGLGRSMRSSGVICYSVAPNDGEIPIHVEVPRFTQPADGFPNGFEVLVAGPSHGRKVLVRLVLSAEEQGHWFSREHQMLAAVWD